jgi:hypothetical protein
LPVAHPMQLFEGHYDGLDTLQFQRSNLKWPPSFARRTPTSISASLRSDGVVITISSKHGIPLLAASLREVCSIDQNFIVICRAVNNMKEK